MKKINLQVKVVYTVNFDCEVTDDIFEALECMQEEYPLGMNDDIIYQAIQALLRLNG